MDGPEFVPLTGKRWSTASAYLRPVLSRPNLQAEVRCMITRVLFEGNRAVGVEYLQNGQKKKVGGPEADYDPNKFIVMATAGEIGRAHV